MLINMSPDAYVTAITMGRSVGIFNTENGHLEEFLEDVHGGNSLGSTRMSIPIYFTVSAIIIRKGKKILERAIKG